MAQPSQFNKGVYLAKESSERLKERALIWHSRVKPSSVVIYPRSQVSPTTEKAGLNLTQSSQFNKGLYLAKESSERLKERALIWHSRVKPEAASFAKVTELCREVCVRG